MTKRERYICRGDVGDVDRLIESFNRFNNVPIRKPINTHGKGGASQ
jgi:hypothetical protein